MAATVSSVWGKPGAWALDAEEHEDELKRDLEDHRVDADPAPSADFPSLSAAAATKTTKKKKGQTLSLAEFNTYKAPAFVEPIVLPTGPRERSAEEMDRSRLGGGFRNYGSDSRVRVSERGEGYNGNLREREKDMGPSRADEVDDWSKMKKTGFGGGNGGGFDRKEKLGFFNSRADEVDNWGSNKSFTPSDGARRERRMGFDSFGSGGGGSDLDSWTMKKEEREGGFEGRRFNDRERRGGGFEVAGRADSEKWGRREERESSDGSGSGRPRLNLQPRTLPVANGGNGQEGPGREVRPKGANPFGEARPREQVLAEKGKDWKEIDEKLEAVKIKEVVGGGERSDEVFSRRKGFGIGRGSFGEDKIERSWRKLDSNEVSRPMSAGKSETGQAEKNEDGVEEEK